MKTIGLLGGMSWVSTHLYYELLNKTTSDRRGTGHQAPILLKSFDYQAFYELQQSGREEEVCKHLVEGGRQLESIGADVLAICANTMHKYFNEIQAAVSIPVLHVADACGAAIQQAGYKTANLLGTKYTMEYPFYRDRLLEESGIATVIPTEWERDEVERIIRTELTRSLFLPESKLLYLDVIANGSASGAECAILGCTEIGLLVKQSDTEIPLFDTTIIHAQALVDWALA